MKARESGMPDEDYWASFFDPACAMDRLWGPEGGQGDVVEFGCGYGTFTLAAAQRTPGIVTALDIEAALVEQVQAKAALADLANVRAEVRDFVADGTGLDEVSQAEALVFNLLHLEAPVALLGEARRVLRPGGGVAVIHWRSDTPTPRGPSLAIRPTPEQCEAWLAEAGFTAIRTIDLSDSCPYHFGLVARRP